MGNTEKLQLFEDRKVRTVWNEAEEQWYFSVKDVVSVLTDTANAKDYISKMRRRDPELSEGWGQIVHPLSLQTAGGVQKENCATMEGIFRIIQSIPSKKAEPFKQWMAQVAAQRIDQAIDPERSIDQAIADYRRLGYSEAWITRRIKTIEIRKGLTDEWKRGGVTKEVDFAFLTDLMSKTWSGLTTKEYKNLKGLTKENLRDNMPNMDHLPDSIVPRIVRGVRIVRQKQSAPILFVEHDGYTCDLTNSHFDKNRWGNPNKELREAFEQLRNEGVKDLYYLTKEELGLSYEAMVDNIHSTDYGMVQYANGYIPKIRQILHMPVGKSFLQNPIKQRREPNNYEWIDRHRAILKRNHEAQPDILMVGNSITHFWGGAPEYHNPRGQESWDKLFKGHTVTNMGYGWDRIENVLWRIYHGEFDGFKAKKIFMMLGTNNIGRCSDNELIDGINFIIPLIMERQPDATLYIVGIYPRRGKEAYVKALNEKLKASLPAYDRLKYINVNEAMLQKDGTLDESLFVGDGLHPNAEGYAKIAKLMKPYVNEK